MRIVENIAIYGSTSNLEFPPGIIDYAYERGAFELASDFTRQDAYQRVVSDYDTDPVALIKRGRERHSRIVFTQVAYGRIKAMGIDLDEIAKQAMEQDDALGHLWPRPNEEKTVVKALPDVNEVFESIVSLGPDVGAIVTASRKALAEGDTRVRMQAREALKGLGFTDEQVSEIELDERRRAVLSRYGLEEGGADEATNGSRQVAWYWPVVGLASRHGLTEEDVARIAVVLSNGPLPEDDNKLRLKRIHAAAKQAIGREIGETVATALSYAHRRQTQRGLHESCCGFSCDCGRRPGRACDCGKHRNLRKVTPITMGEKRVTLSQIKGAHGADDHSQTIAGGDGVKPSGGAKKVGQRGALNMVREEYTSVNDAACRFPNLGKGGTQVWFARPHACREGYSACKAAGRLPNVRTLSESHVLLGTVKESSPDVIYKLLQRGKWSPHGEAVGLLERKGVARESQAIGVGDVIVSRTGAWYVDTKGFTRIET